MWQKILTFLSSNALVGLLGIFGFGIALYPYVKGRFSSYSVAVEAPDSVNFFCEGTEGVDQGVGPRPPCLEETPLVFMATPMFYINEGSADKTVWLRRELVDIRFENTAKKPRKEITLAWERVSSAADWHAPSVETVDSAKAISHSTLFYPETFGCDKGVLGDDCLKANTFKWEEFVDLVTSRDIVRAVFTFRPAIKGPAQQKETTCQWTFNDGVVAELNAWKAKLAKYKALAQDLKSKGLPVESIHSEGRPYSYLAANCESP